MAAAAQLSELEGCEMPGGPPPPGLPLAPALGLEKGAEPGCADVMMPGRAARRCRTNAAMTPPTTRSPPMLPPAAAPAVAGEAAAWLLSRSSSSGGAVVAPTLWEAVAAAVALALTPSVFVAVTVVEGGGLMLPLGLRGTAAAADALALAAMAGVPLDEAAAEPLGLAAPMGDSEAPAVAAAEPLLGLEAPAGCVPVIGVPLAPAGVGEALVKGVWPPAEDTGEAAVAATEALGLTAACGAARQARTAAVEEQASLLQP